MPFGQIKFLIISPRPRPYPPLPFFLPGQAKIKPQGPHRPDKDDSSGAGRRERRSIHLGSSYTGMFGGMTLSVRKNKGD